MVIDLISGT